MASSVEVSVEVLQECLVQEITLDGQEIYVSPLTMSENLTKLAHKIDFSKIDADDKKTISEVVDDEETDRENEQQQQHVVVQPPLWPWESIRNKLRNAQSELEALHDIIAIARDRRYMIIEQVHPDNIDTRTGLLLVARKRAMSTAASIINTGLDRMKKNLEMVAKNKNQDFHYEMLRLRKSYKLKKTGTSILGDLSYKSSGSRYWVSGTFEVTKTDGEGSEIVESSSYSSVGAPHPSPLISNLSVTIPEDLSGLAQIRISIRHVTEKDFNLDMFFAQSFLSTPSYIKQPDNLPWFKKLEMAQQVIFCREAFHQLTLEATTIKGKVPSIACGNRLVCHLFPDVKLFVTLIHQKGGSSKNSMLKNSIYQQEPHDQVLEHCLYQLLRDLHVRNASFPMPHPVSTQLRTFKAQHLIGPSGYTRSEIDDLYENLAHKVALESLVNMAKLQVMRQRVADLLDELAHRLKEPLICIFAVSLNHVHKVSFKVVISFSGFDNVKTGFTVYVTHKSIEVATKEGQYLYMNQNFEELRDFIMGEVASNHIFVTHVLARHFNWKVMSTNKQSTTDEELSGPGTGPGTIIASPSHIKKISVCCSSSGKIKVMILRMTPPERKDSSTKTGMSLRWRTALAGFELVDLRKVPGVHFAYKMENLIALLT